MRNVCCKTLQSGCQIKAFNFGHVFCYSKISGLYRNKVELVQDDLLVSRFKEFRKECVKAPKNRIHVVLTREGEKLDLLYS